MIINSQLSTTEPKKQKQNKKTNQTTRTGTVSQKRDHMEGYQQIGEAGRTGEKVQRISSINGR